MAKIKPIEGYDAAFIAGLSRKLNEVIGSLNLVLNMRGSGGVKVDFSNSNVDIRGASGLPDGYGPEEWTVYDGGVVTTRNFLTDNPD